MISTKPGKKNTAKKIKDNVVPIRWKKLKNNNILITNDFGNCMIISQKMFNLYINGRITKKHKLYREFEEKGFIKTFLNFDNLFRKWKSSNSYLFSGPALHILVTTLRCNHKCVYCQSQAVNMNSQNTDMSFQTAIKAIDIAFNSPSKNLIIEFQGGEPLCNWEVVKKATEYARKKEEESDKKLSISIVTNLSLMDEKKADFLLKNEVSICTSLDGPKKLHNLNRIYSNASSYDITIKWIRYFNNKYEKQYGLPYKIFKPSALLTVSKDSLKYPKEIIDEYIKNNLQTIFIRPLSPIGFAKKHWNIVGYTAIEFIDFYKKSLKYILEQNIKGKILYEKTAQMLLNKMVNSKDSGFTDLRCPCGAAVGQIAYNFNGDIYTCDEGRMVAWEGDNSFKIGNITDNYNKLITSPASRICIHTSNLENQPRCSRCPHKVWCGVCPVVNYEAQGSFWGDNFTSQRCEIMMGIFETIIEFFYNKKYKNILIDWIKS
ncbi:MAG: His-Xaa-Ser system radical SAM maturase HxsB [Elusimicrobiales bacterium]|nr:His-Xaa-Ser system radical SAM maturase HxsB [Elusimicrobiales bacterium]